MTGRENLRNGAKRLYEEPTLRDSPAFNIIMPILGKGVAVIGMVGDKILDALGINRIGRYFNPPGEEKQPGYPANEPNPDPTMATGYNMAMQTVPVGVPVAYQSRMDSMYNRGCRE